MTTCAKCGASEYFGGRVYPNGMASPGRCSSADACTLNAKLRDLRTAVEGVAERLDLMGDHVAAQILRQACGGGFLVGERVAVAGVAFSVRGHVSSETDGVYEVTLDDGRVVHTVYAHQLRRVESGPSSR